LLFSFDITVDSGTEVEIRCRIPSSISIIAKIEQGKFYLVIHNNRISNDNKNNIFV
jgi:hypothetical protein